MAGSFPMSALTDTLAARTSLDDEQADHIARPTSASGSCSPISRSPTCCYGFRSRCRRWKPAANRRSCRGAVPPHHGPNGVPAGPGRRRPARRADRRLSVASSRDFRFWRIASVAAGLAIAALVVGSNLSQAPPATRPRTAVPEAATPSPLRKASSRVLTKNKPAAAVQAKPAAMAVAESKPSHAAGVPATKNAGLHKGQPSRPAQVSHNDVIAKDTVVYFDRKGRPSSHKPLPDMSAKRSSESN